VRSELTFLVVEETTEVADFLRDFLGECGLRGVVAGTLECARALAPHADAIIASVGLPDGSGIELLDELRACGDMKPVAIISGYDSNGFRQEMTRWITKPFSLDELKRAVNELAEQAEAIRALADAPAVVRRIETRHKTALARIESGCKTFLGGHDVR